MFGFNWLGGGYGPFSFMKHITTGFTRQVLIIGTNAYKLPYFCRGWSKFIEGMYCNISETQVWKVSKSPYLCPVLWSFGGFILVMPKVKILTKKSEIPDIHIKEDGSDNNPANYGYYDNEIVCIDYAYHRLIPFK